MFIDTHSHLFLGELAHHIPEALDNLEKFNFSHSIQIGTGLATSKTCIELSQKHDILRATIGIHPCEAQNLPTEDIPSSIAILENYIQEYRLYIVGIGEIGFDHYHLSEDEEVSGLQKSRQIEWYRAQAALAQKYDLPVVIHSRKANSLTLVELRTSWLEKFDVHCFSENWEFAKKIFDLGEFSRIGFTGILTYKNAASVQEVAIKSPLDRILIETDAPYLIPDPLQKNVTYCQPHYTYYVFQKLCELRSESSEVIEKTLWESSKSFFSLQ